MTAPEGRPRVVVLRGTSVNPWDLKPWESLRDAFDVVVPVPPNNAFDTGQLALRQLSVRTAGGRLESSGSVGRLALRAVGERYVGLAKLLEGADIVHAAELGTWFSAQAAAARARLGYRLVLTVWETLPFVNAYRNIRTRPYRQRVLAETDLFLPTTERAREALLLEGAPVDRIRVSSPGIELERYSTARTAQPPSDGRHLVLSVGRLVWEKGHQDLLRAVALLRTRGRDDVRVLIVGTGEAERRLHELATDLGLGGVVEFRGWVPHEEMQEVYATASCLVLGSLSVWFWEEQFGMVLIEALAAHVPVLASSSGAIPEVLAGNGTLFPPGDWVGLADALARGPLGSSTPQRRAPKPEHLAHFSTASAAARLRSAYDELLSHTPPRAP